MSVSSCLTEGDDNTENLLNMLPMIGLGKTGVVVRGKRCIIGTSLADMGVESG